MVIVGLFFAYIAVFGTGVLSALFNIGTAGQFLVFLIVAFAAIAFPYRRKDVFNSAEPLARRKIEGIPLITILGVLSVAVSIFTIYSILKPNIGGKNALSTLFYGIVLAFIIGAIIYAIAYFVRKSQGIDLSLLQREIPPE